MNKTIEKFGQEAFEFAANSAAADTLGAFAEKFSELIVQECCDMVNEHTQHNNSNDCPLVLKIKEHFGVK